MLKLLADENVPKRLVRFLAKYGIDVVRLQDLGLRGIGDQELVKEANRLERTILTRDFDPIMPRILSKYKKRCHLYFLSTHQK